MFSLAKLAIVRNRGVHILGGEEEKGGRKWKGEVEGEGGG